MMECGPAEITHNRKWIIDLDGKLEDLRSMGFLAPDAPCLEEVRSTYMTYIILWLSFVVSDGAMCVPQQKDELQALVVRFGSAVSHALHSECRFLDAPCYFALKSRHKTKEGVRGYSNLSWHLTLLGLAPYADWRRAMLYVEKHVYPRHQQQGGSMHISLLSDAHITRNSKVLFHFYSSNIDSHHAASSHSQGQFIQTLLSEKVEPGVPATGRRFTLDGIFTPDGCAINLVNAPEREAISFMATSMVLPVRHIFFVLYSMGLKPYPSRTPGPESPIWRASVLTS